MWQASRPPAFTRCWQFFGCRIGPFLECYLSLHGLDGTHGIHYGFFGLQRFGQFDMGILFQRESSTLLDMLFMFCSAGLKQPEGVARRIGDFATNNPSELPTPGAKYTSRAFKTGSIGYMCSRDPRPLLALVQQNPQPFCRWLSVFWLAESHR